MSWRQAGTSTLAALAGAAVTLETSALPVWARAVCAAVIAVAAAVHIAPSASAEQLAADLEKGPWT